MTQTEQTQATSQTEEALGEIAMMLKVNKARKLAAKQKRQQSAMRNYIQRVTKEYRRVQKRLNTELRVLEGQIGKKDFAMLKDICTVHTPEQKNEQGEVTQAASSYVNKKALLVEARNLLVLKREDRMKQGLRKRSTGRSSRRTAHNSAVRYLTQRNAVAAKENSEVK